MAKGSDAYNAGVAAAKAGKSYSSFPGKRGEAATEDWVRGWEDANRDNHIKNSFSNGRQRAEAYLNQRMAAAGVRVENAMRMTVQEIIKGAKEGRWDPQEDVEGKRPGQHVWVKRNGKDIHIEVK